MTDTPTRVKGAEIRSEQAHEARRAAAILVEAGMASAAAAVLRIAAEKSLAPDAFQQQALYRHSYLVTVLSGSSREFTNLHEIADAIRDGDCTGMFELHAMEGLDVEEAREACHAVGSDPGFFLHLAETTQHDTARTAECAR